MGTTLTGTTPQDTYDSLIKVTDNGPLSGSLKTLTDGLGNDSALALSTGAASVTGTLAVTAGTNLATASGNVGIGIAVPARKLEVMDSLRVTTAGTSRYFDVTEGTIKLYSSNAEPSIKFADYNTGLDRVATIGYEGDFFGRGAISFVVKEQGSGTAAEAMRLTAAGKVGIGTSSPQASAILHVNATGDYTDEGAPFTVGSSTVGNMRLYVGVNNTSNYSYIGSVESGTAYRNLALQPNGGNVGIGTTSPSSTFKLTVNSGSNVNSFLNGDKISFSRTSDNATDVAYLSRTNDLGVNGTANIHGYDGIQFRTQGPESVKATITAAGNVGIGKTSPSNALHIGKAAVSILLDGLKVDRDPSTSTSSIFNAFGGATNIVSNSGVTSSFTSHIVFGLSDNTTTTEIARITSNGLTFNGDTAAANALDDYEEGTWTIGLTFDGSSTGMTTFYNTGTYTKVGRQVTVNGFFGLTNKGSSTGGARITGLPFTVANSNAYYSPATLRFYNITYTGTLQAFAVKNTTTIQIDDVTESGVVSSITNSDFANDSDIMISLTYFV